MILMALFFQTQLKIHNFCWETVLFFYPRCDTKVVTKQQCVSYYYNVSFERGEESENETEPPKKETTHLD